MLIMPPDQRCEPIGADRPEGYDKKNNERRMPRVAFEGLNDPGQHSRVSGNSLLSFETSGRTPPGDLALDGVVVFFGALRSC